MLFQPIIIHLSSGSSVEIVRRGNIVFIINTGFKRLENLFRCSRGDRIGGQNQFQIIRGCGEIIEEWVDLGEGEVRQGICKFVEK